MPRVMVFVVCHFRGVTEGLIKKVTFKQTSEGDAGEKQEKNWEKSIRSTGNSKCKGPEAGTRLVSSRNSKGASVAGEK